MISDTTFSCFFALSWSSQKLGSRVFDSCSSSSILLLSMSKIAPQRILSSYKLFNLLRIYHKYEILHKDNVIISIFNCENKNIFITFVVIGKLKIYEACLFYDKKMTFR